MSVPIKINGKHLYQIMDPETWDDAWSAEQIARNSIKSEMLPTEVYLTSETYSRNAERTADYELEDLQIVNRKAKPEITWSLLRYEYAQRLFIELGYTYNLVVKPVAAPVIYITFYDFTGERTISAYLGQTIEGTLVEYDGVKYWQNLRIAFPER